MATYKYRITDKFGRDKKGTLEAGSPGGSNRQTERRRSCRAFYRRDYECRKCLLEHNDR